MEDLFVALIYCIIALVVLGIVFRKQLRAEKEHQIVARTIEQSARLSTIVRRYRENPPLVRDAGGKWRTGRLDLVLGGDFDLVQEGLQ